MDLCTSIRILLNQDIPVLESSYNQKYFWIFRNVFREAEITVSDDPSDSACRKVSLRIRLNHRIIMASNYLYRAEGALLPTAKTNS